MITSAAALRAIRSTTQWLVPHFEKMLYDNAQLLELLALLARETGEDGVSSAPPRKSSAGSRAK